MRGAARPLHYTPHTYTQTPSLGATSRVQRMLSVYTPYARRLVLVRLESEDPAAEKVGALRGLQNQDERMTRCEGIGGRSSSEPRRIRTLGGDVATLLHYCAVGRSRAGLDDGRRECKWRAAHPDNDACVRAAGGRLIAALREAAARAPVSGDPAVGFPMASGTAAALPTSCSVAKWLQRGNTSPSTMELTIHRSLVVLRHPDPVMHDCLRAEMWRSSSAWFLSGDGTRYRGRLVTLVLLVPCAATPAAQSPAACEWLQWHVSKAPAELTPGRVSWQVSLMLDRLYSKFDQLSEQHRIFKVETIGDAYMAVANLVEDV